MKVKPANHLFRVGTDADRMQYQEERRQELRAFLEPRERLASAVAGEAMLSISRDDGFAVCASGTVSGTEELVALARETVDDVDLVAKKADANKPFMVKLLDMKSMTRASPLLRFALRRDVVATAANYLGMVPILQYANVVYSSEAGAELSKSQLYHCDSDEAEQVKIFILCEPVTPNEGPLTFVPASQSQQVRDRVGYRYKHRLTDEQVQTAYGDVLREVALTGPAGTLAFLDTSRCLHYGSRISAPDVRRLVIMLQYVTPSAFILPDYPAGTTFGALAPSGRDAVEQLVLGAAAA
jgi:phytanoyl-CoA dioxygenase PhyH